MLSPEVGFLSLFLKSIPKGGEHALKSEIPWRMEGLLDCYLLILLILALAALTLGGMGSPESVSAVGRCYVWWDVFRRSLGRTCTLWYRWRCTLHWCSVHLYLLWDDFRGKTALLGQLWSV